MTNENDWVTQDVVPDRNHLDEWRWVSTVKQDSPWNKSIEETHFSHGHTVGNAMFEVRCKRKDHPALGKVKSQMVSQDELNAEPRTRAWTFGTPAQTGHFLICHGDPAIVPDEIHAVTVTVITSHKLWFIYLGQTSDFADPVVPKAKYTLLSHTAEPFSKWCKDPADVQEKLDLGWIIVKEQEMQVPEWDR
jgi:hypothetical protein